MVAGAEQSVLCAHGIPVLQRSQRSWGDGSACELFVFAEEARGQGRKRRRMRERRRQRRRRRERRIKIKEAEEDGFINKGLTLQAWGT